MWTFPCHLVFSPSHFLLFFLVLVSSQPPSKVPQISLIPSYHPPLSQKIPDSCSSSLFSRTPHHQKSTKLPANQTHSDQSEIVNVTTKVTEEMMTNLIGTSDGRPSNKCPDHYDELYCYNGGTCVRFAVEQDALYSCECLDGFIGERCETKYPTSIKNSEYFYCFFLFYSKITPFLPIASNLLRFSNGWDLN